MTIAGHKLNAPKGVGALFVRRGTPIHPVLLGAGPELGLRPGTENVASIVGLGVACELAERAMATKSQWLAELRDRLWETQTRVSRWCAGLFVGGSAGTAVVAALRTAASGRVQGPVVALLPDSCDRYFSREWMFAATASSRSRA